MDNVLKLNLGSGKNPKAGFVNVDKYGTPDILHDLEVFPWPWEDNSVEEIEMNHVLEHLGQLTETYLNIIKELYRVCKNGAIINITVPHPRHNDFLYDPTHVRPILPESFQLFSKKLNKKWIANNNPNTPLALYLDVDFELLNINYTLDPIWTQKMSEENLSQEDIYNAAKSYNNVIKEIRIPLKVIK